MNNQKFSDVQFSVGPQQKLIYAHRMILASGKLNLLFFESTHQINSFTYILISWSQGSPVFEQYFYADHELRVDAKDPKPIEVPDLTVVGFTNMIK